MLTKETNIMKNYIFYILMLQAQLRASVFLALEEQESIHVGPHSNKLFINSFISINNLSEIIETSIM